MKKILVVALSVAILLSTTACGTNSELEAIKQKNEQLKQTIDELQKDLAQQTSSPQSTDAPSKAIIWHRTEILQLQSKKLTVRITNI